MRSDKLQKCVTWSKWANER